MCSVCCCCCCCCHVHHSGAVLVDTETVLHFATLLLLLLLPWPGPPRCRLSVFTVVVAAAAAAVVVHPVKSRIVLLCCHFFLLLFCVHGRTLLNSGDSLFVFFSLFLPLACSSFWCTVFLCVVLKMTLDAMRRKESILLVVCLPLNSIIKILFSLS